MQRITSCICACLLVAFFGAPVSRAADLIIALKSLEVEPYEIALASIKKTLERGDYDLDIEERVLQDDLKENNILLAQIQKRKPRLILTLGSAATSFIAKGIKDTPVVFCMVLNPIASGLIQSNNDSGNNLTGGSLDIPLKEQFEALRTVVPSLKKVGVIYSPQETGSVIQQAEKTVQGMGLELVRVPIVSPKEVPNALRKLDGRVDALWAVADSTVFSSGSTEFILLHTLRNRIPFMGLSPAFVKAGALMALAADYREVGMQCGELATRILDGDPPSAVPVTVPKKITMYLNLKTAELIGLKISPDQVKGAVLVE